MSNTFGFGQAFPEDAYDEFGALCFVVRQLIAEMSTMTLVQVVACSNSGAAAPVGTVDVQPLVSMLDGNGNATQHGVIRGFPYFRLQGGASAIILDPVIGDVGYCTFSHHDLSAVIAAKAAGNPGSMRKFDMSDGIYVGGALNGTPTSALQFMSDGSIVVGHSAGQLSLSKSGAVSLSNSTGTNITIDAAGNINLNPASAAVINFIGNVNFEAGVTGTGGSINFGGTNLTTTGAVSVGALASNGHNVGSTHQHSGVTTGGGTSGPPL